MFVPAEKIKAKARVAIMGPAGSGKTFTALKIAAGLGKRIAVIDTENASAAKYANKDNRFDVAVLKNFSPQDYIKAIQAAKDYDVLVIDSLSHAWSGKGGILEMVDRIVDKSDSKNSYVAWGKATPEHNKLIEAIVSAEPHLVCTFRVKTEYNMQQNSHGKLVPVRIGLAPIQREGVEYEFDLVADINLEHEMTIIKTRCPAFDGAQFKKPDEDIGKQLLVWLNDGSEAPIKPREDVEIAKAMFLGKEIKPDDPPVRAEEMKQLLDSAEHYNWTKADINEFINSKNYPKPLLRSHWQEITTHVASNPRN